jgi:hypothetical protein
VCTNYEVTPKLVFHCVVNFGGVTEWYQSFSYSELGRFQNLNYNWFLKFFLSLSPLFDIRVRLLPGNLYALFFIHTSIIWLMNISPSNDFALSCLLYILVIYETFSRHCSWLQWSHLLLRHCGLYNGLIYFINIVCCTMVSFICRTL